MFSRLNFAIADVQFTNYNTPLTLLLGQFLASFINKICCKKQRYIMDY